MKHTLSEKPALVFGMAILLLASCSSHKSLVFANREWIVSDYYCQIIDKDSTYRMTTGNILLPDPLLIVSSADSVAKYPDMDKFLSDILHTAHLDGAEILFYSPDTQTMYVRPKGDIPPLRPSSVSSPMTDERPYTTWIYEDDMEDWTREPSEMYTYTYFDKRKKRLLIVDHFDYGDTPIAQITIFQSKNKMTEKMNVRESFRRAYYEVHDLRKAMRDIEYWAHGVEARRATAFVNYRIGQEQKLGKKWTVH